MTNLLSVIGLLVLLSCQPQADARRAAYKTFMIKSSGEVETLPDEASFNITLSCLDPSIQAAKECLVEKSNELQEQLLSLGIAQDDILTTSVNLNKQYTWQRDRRVFEGYNSSTSLYITVSALDSLDEIYTTLLENSNLDLSSLSYSHSQLDSLKNEAYAQALENANGLADKLLSELPESEKEIMRIGNVELSASLPEANELTEEVQYDREVALDARAKSVAISKGTVVVNATLFVEYRVE